MASRTTFIRAKVTTKNSAAATSPTATPQRKPKAAVVAGIEAMISVVGGRQAPPLIDQGADEEGDADDDDPGGEEPAGSAPITGAPDRHRQQARAGRDQAVGPAGEAEAVREQRQRQRVIAGRAGAEGRRQVGDADGAQLAVRIEVGAGGDVDRRGAHHRRDDADPHRREDARGLPEQRPAVDRERPPAAEGRQQPPGEGPEQQVRPAGAVEAEAEDADRAVEGDRARPAVPTGRTIGLPMRRARAAMATAASAQGTHRTGWPASNSRPMSRAWTGWPTAAPSPPMISR